MALNSQYSIASRNVSLDARTARLANGYLRIYSGAQPASADTAVGGGPVLLAEHRFGAPAFAPAAAAAAIANALAAAPTLATGVATWFRCLQADGVTVECDGTAGRNGFAADGVTAAAGATYNLNLLAPNYQLGADSLVQGLVLSAPAQGA